MDAGTIYKLLPLDDSIRLCLLHPGPTGSRLICNLIYTTIEDITEDIYSQYTALSYVWGDQSQRETIEVDGNPFSITSNLASALHGLRHPQQSIMVWADALCINQLDIEERNRQVGLMKDIYSLANQTVIYLCGSHKLCETMFNSIRSSRSQTYDNSQHLEAVNHILSQPWFGRVWVYQELVLSSKVLVQCGTSRLRWETFCTELLGESGGFSYKLAQYRRAAAKKGEDENNHHIRESSTLDTLLTMLSDMNQARQRGSDNSLPDILLSRRGMGVTDPRDLIFGHLAVAGVHQTKHPGRRRVQLPKVDYGKSIAEVFIDGATCAIEWSGISLLARMDLHDVSAKRKDIPSWVPDWSLSSSAYLPAVTAVESHKYVSWSRSGRRKERSGWAEDTFLFNAQQRRSPFSSDYEFPTADSLAFECLRLGSVKELTLEEFKPLDDEHHSRIREYRSLLQQLPEADQSDSKEQNITLQYKFFRETYESFRNILPERILRPLPQDSDRILTNPIFMLIWGEFFREESSSLRNIRRRNLKFLDFLMRYAFGIHKQSFLIGRKVAVLDTDDVVVVPNSTQVGDVVCCSLEVREEPLFMVLHPRNEGVMEKGLNEREKGMARAFGWVGMAWSERIWRFDEVNGKDSLVYAVVR